MAQVTERNIPLPLYLGPQLPRWRPATVADVERAIQSGAISERHWLDVKLTTGASTPGNNKEIAADLASFANDGGAIIYGVGEDKATGTFAVEPFDLSGQPERIDEVVRTRCDPPLFVACHPLPVDPANRTHGLLLVEVPPSVGAPHMVEGRYYGRGDTTNRRLNDAEVARLHSVRTIRHLSAEKIIDQEIARDPMPPKVRTRSHIYVVARPLAAPPDLLTEAIERRRVGPLVREVAGSVQQVGYPPWTFLGNEEPRAQGWAVCSHTIQGRRAYSETGDANRAEKGMLDLEVGDDGSLALVCGRGSDPYGEEQTHLVLDPSVAMHVRGVVDLAGRIGREHGYGGRWLIVVGVTDLAGRYTAETAHTTRYGAAYVPFSADRYIESTEAVTAELQAQPGTVTRRLVRRLMRGLATSPQAYGQLLDNPAS